MPQLRVITARDPDVLLRHAASGFLGRRTATADAPFPTIDYLLCLRQGALRDDVVQLAREAGSHGWFESPLCIFHEMPERLGVDSAKTVGEYERLVILTEIVRDKCQRMFAPNARTEDFGGDIDRLVGQLLGEGVAPDDLDNALRTIARARMDDEAFETARDADIVAVYRAYRETLTLIGRRDPRESLVCAARMISSGAVNLSTALEDRREIRIFGLADLRGGWRALLAALSGSPDLDALSIYTSAILDFGGLPVELEALDEPISIASLLFGESSFKTDNPACAPLVSHISAPDTDREMDTIATGVRALIDGGTPPDRIAIISRQARPHVDDAVRALARVGVPSTARLRIGLKETPVVRALCALLEAAADGWSRYGLTHIARSPYIECDLDPRIIDYLGYQRRIMGLPQWARALDELAELARARESQPRDDSNESHSRVPLLADINHARDRFASFTKRAKDLDRSRNLAEWLAWLEDFLEGDDWGVAVRMRKLASERYEIVRRDLAAASGLASIAREWRDAAASYGTEANLTSKLANKLANKLMTVAEFAKALAPSLDSDLTLNGATAFGVQVLEAPAAAYRAFDHVFVVGMCAGAFPTVPSRSSIWDEADRETLRAAGIPLDGRDAWELREQELFRVLIAGARDSLTVSHSRMDETGSEVIASAFVEELAAVANMHMVEIPTSRVTVPGIPLYTLKGAPAAAAHAAQVERLRAFRFTSAYNGAITDPDVLEFLAMEFGDDRRWSPTQLEEFAKCPWAFLTKRLMRLERLEDPDEDMDASVRGAILHDALARFYDSAIARCGKPVFLLPEDTDWAEPLMSGSLNAAIAGQGRTWLGHPSLMAAKRAELHRILQGFMQWEIQLHSDMIALKTRKVNAPKMVRTGVSENELAFDDMIFERDGVRIRYRGTIDRVEVSVDERIPGLKMIAAVDYKTTKASTPGGGKKEAWDDGVVIQVPLYAYALSKLYPDHQTARVEYIALNPPGSELPLQLYTIDKKSGQLGQDDEAIASWDGALDQAISHVRQARRGEFPAQPPASCGCPPWCHGIDICRIPRSEVKQ